MPRVNRADAINWASGALPDGLHPEMREQINLSDLEDIGASGIISVC